jgi:hypothetical protein
MQAQAAEFSGYAGRFRCFLERRVLKQTIYEETLRYIQDRF